MTKRDDAIRRLKDAPQNLAWDELKELMHDIGFNSFEGFIGKPYAIHLLIKTKRMSVSHMSDTRIWNSFPK